MTSVHTAFYKITSISFLISVTSHIFVAGFYLSLKKKKMQTFTFWHPRYHFMLVGKFLCDCLLHTAANCLLGLQMGSEELQGVFFPSWGSRNIYFAAESLQGPSSRSGGQQHPSQGSSASAALQKDWGAFRVQTTQHRVAK